MKVAPSIICADFRNLGSEVKKLEEAGADLLHFDIMDGRYVPNITIGPLVLEALRNETDLPFDTHLMIQEPDRYIESFAISGADILTIHMDSTLHLHRTLEMIRSFDVSPGVSLNPTTPLTFLECVLDFVDVVLIMGVNPGFAGQSFVYPVLKKIENLRRMIDDRGLAVQIEVDGGMRPALAQEVEMAGANIVVAGAGVFLDGSDYSMNIAELRGEKLAAAAS